MTFFYAEAQHGGFYQAKTPCLYEAAGWTSRCAWAGRR